jgi:hypothetical protein
MDKEIIINFEYGILADGKLIAAFDTVVDRDDCLDLLAEKWKDCQFEAIDDEQ